MLSAGNICCMWIWLVCGLFHLTEFCECNEENEEVRLFNKLFNNNNYSPLVRPVLDRSHAVDVRLDIAFVQLVALDDREQSLTSNLWVRQFWRNEFLTWNPDEYGGLKEITVNKTWVWKPDIVLYNSAESRLNGQLDQHKTRIKLKYDGQNIWFIPAIMMSGCSIDIEYFPFDYQKCELKFGSWTYLLHELNLIAIKDVMDTNSYLESSEFWLLDTEAKRNEETYSCCPNPFVDVTYKILLKRKPGFYTFYTIVPSLMLTFFALFTFAFPENIGERMGLAIDCFLTISILMNMVSDSIPIDSNVTPMLMRFLIICIILMTMTIFMNALCFNMIGTKPMPRWLKDLVHNKFGPLVMWQSCTRSLKDRGTCSSTAICEGLFAANMTNQSDTTDGFEEFGEHNSNFEWKFTPKTWQSSLKNLEKKYSHNYRDETSNFNLLDDNEVNIEKEDAVNRDVENIRKLAEQVVDDVEAEYTADVWRCFSQAIDRVMLFIFFVTYLSINVILFLRIPKVNLE